MNQWARYGIDTGVGLGAAMVVRSLCCCASSGTVGGRGLWRGGGGCCDDCCGDDGDPPQTKAIGLIPPDLKPQPLAMPTANARRDQALQQVRLRWTAQNDASLACVVPQVWPVEVSAVQHPLAAVMLGDRLVFADLGKCVETPNGVTGLWMWVSHQRRCGPYQIQTPDGSLPVSERDFRSILSTFGFSAQLEEGDRAINCITFEETGAVTLKSGARQWRNFERVVEYDNEHQLAARVGNEPLAVPALVLSKR